MPKYKNKAVYLTPAGEVVGREYQAEKTKVADSRKEYRRFQTLMQLQQGGRIVGLRRQHTFKLSAHGEVLCRYVADFTYVVCGRLVVEDVKSDMTRKLPMYRLKKKWMWCEHRIRILET